MKYIFTLILSICLLRSHAQKKDVIATSNFLVTGMVKKQTKITIDDLQHFKSDILENVTIKSRHGNEKEVVKNLKGILLKTILDSVGIDVDQKKEYSELAIVLVAVDGYKNVYSWNELFNTEVGNHVYIITEIEGKPLTEMKDKILVFSLSDIVSGRRHLKALSKIEIKKV